MPEVLVILQDVEYAAEDADGVGAKTFDSNPSEPSCSDTLLEARGAGPWTGLSFHIVVRALPDGDGPGIPLPYCRSALLDEGTGALLEPAVYMPWSYLLGFHEPSSYLREGDAAAGVAEEADAAARSDEDGEGPGKPEP